MHSLHRGLGVIVLLAAASAGAYDSVHTPRGDLPLWTPVRPDPPDPIIQAASPFDAGQMGVDWLTGALCNWMNGAGQTADCADGNTTKTCFGCHVQSETVFGLARSASRCYTVPDTVCAGGGDESPLEFITRYVAGAQRKACILGTFSIDCALAGIIPVDLTTRDGQPPELGSIGHYPPCGSNAPPASIHPVMQSAHGGLTLAGYTRHIAPTYASNLLALADWFLTRQAGTGQWIPDRAESPVDQGEAFVTGAAVVSLVTAIPHGTAAQAANYAQSVDRAVVWAEGASYTTTQDKVFGLLILREGGRPNDDPAVLLLRDDLLDDQLADGGWAERPGLGSNAYATGQALWALLETGLDLNDTAVCGGVQWLVDNQDPDGSWPMGTTGVNTDASRPSRFTATMWPVMALGTLSPFGATLTLTAESVETCDETVSIPVLVRHAGDSPCGLFGQADTYDLTAWNDLGDGVTVTPVSIDLLPGEAKVVTLEWTRSGPARPPGTVSLTTIHAESLGSIAAGCPVQAETTVSVVVPDDSIPTGIGSGLRVARRNRDVTLRWAPPAGPVGGYEVMSHACTDAACSLPPTAPTLEGAPPRASTSPFENRAVLTGDALPGSPRILFYKVRALSPCSRAPGATCDYDCTDPDLCHLGCL